MAGIKKKASKGMCRSSDEMSAGKGIGAAGLAQGALGRRGMRDVGVTHLAVVLLEGHVESMMATVLRRPVPADDSREACGNARGEAGWCGQVLPMGV